MAQTLSLTLLGQQICHAPVEIENTSYPFITFCYQIFLNLLINDLFLPII